MCVLAKKSVGTHLLYELKQSTRQDDMLRVVGYSTPLSIEDENSLVDVELARPSPTGRDLLVEIKAISVNPADTKVRANARPEANTWKVLGWDAAGVVVEAGPEARQLKPGD